VLRAIFREKKRQMANEISTEKRVNYARGYLELGLLTEAASEIDRIALTHREEISVLEVTVDLRMETHEWTELISAARQLAAKAPQTENAWIAWAYALRELGQIEEAREVLLTAEPLHGRTSGVLHYNLACYYCMLGESEQAMQRFMRAYHMSSEWKSAALGDPDLAGLRKLIAQL
jgi:Flp pilus assembly protein TadD